MIYSMKVDSLQMLFKHAAAEFCCCDTTPDFSETSTQAKWLRKLNFTKREAAKSAAVLMLTNVLCISTSNLRLALILSTITDHPFLSYEERDGVLHPSLIIWHWKPPYYHRKPAVMSSVASISLWWANEIPQTAISGLSMYNHCTEHKTLALVRQNYSKVHTT